MLRIVTDGAADMPPAWEKEFDIQVIPVNIQFGDKTYLQGVELDNEGFYRKVDETKTIPKTSQPSPHQFVEFYKKVAKPGDTILSIHITSKLSGTYASAVQAAEELKGTYNVMPFDSMVGSVAIGFMCREARKMERAGKSVEQIVKALEAVRGRIRIYPDAGYAGICPHERPRGRHAGRAGLADERQADRGADGRRAEHDREGADPQGLHQPTDRHGRARVWQDAGVPGRGPGQ